MAKPFVKWAGGKSQLIPQIMARMPTGCTRYVEPFIGGGAVLFSIAERFDEVYISDTNAQLIGVYMDVRDHVDELISSLNDM
ncbi:MAG TPA: DNA adenine methylase, partial [Methanocorpusculum sp.]|nr:DNA adenine methylase [Methanocorpusculum sp.]